MKRYALLLCVWYCVSLQTSALGDQQHLDDEHPVWRKLKLIHQLWVNNLTVTQRLVVNGHEITGQTSSSGISSYGQLSVTEQEIVIDEPDSWVTIPFNAAGPTSNMSVSTISPATITIEQDGVYQINVSLLFAAEESDEGSFDVGTYQLGLNVNGVTMPVAAVYATNPSQLSLNYNSIMELAAGDQIQWYMQSSSVTPPPFNNNIILEHGYAYVMQIS